MMYTEKVMDHFQNPRNVGLIPDADGVGKVGNPVCGDMMTFYIKVKDDRLADVKFQTFGCGAAIAVSSIVSEMAMGKTLDEAMAVTNELVAQELGGLPKNKMHCSNLGADALHAAIRDYRDRRAGVARPAGPAGEGREHDEECHCPYCDMPLDEEDTGACRVCHVELAECPSCGGITKTGEKCLHCGAEIKKA
jgi:nitrogen fixation NifU-like protein